jgi:hypothetical protein
MALKFVLFASMLHIPVTNFLAPLLYLNTMSSLIQPEPDCLYWVEASRTTDTSEATCLLSHGTNLFTGQVVLV